MKHDHIIDLEEVKEGNIMNKAGKIVLRSVIGVFALITVCSSFVVVPAGHTGVIVTLGKVSDKVYSEGFHLKVPFVQEVEKLSNKIQVYETDCSAVSKDLQTVNSTLAVNYRIGLDDSASIYKNIGRDYESIVLMPVVQECVKSVTAQYTAEELITERTIVGDQIKEQLDSKVQNYGIFIEKFNIVNFDFSEEFNTAIEAKQVAEQNLIKTQTEQKQAIAIAEAEAKKKVIAADAEAQAIRAEAQANADANELLKNSLSEILLKYQTIDAWDGVLPKVSGSEGNLISVDLDDLPADTTPAQ